MKQIFAVLSFAFFGLCTPLAAQNNPVVVELYTSQGCSICPAADALLQELALRDDVIALALHVDYWDYIGWEDPFGDPAHSDRQRAYAATENRSIVFTPQIVVNGTTDIVGAKRSKLAQAIAQHAAEPALIVLDITRDGDEVRIHAENIKNVSGDITIHMLRYIPTSTTVVKRGENRGKTLTQSNIVEGWTVLGQWDGRAPLEMTSTVSGDRPVVVLLQQENTGPIVAAARLR